MSSGLALSAVYVVVLGYSQHSINSDCFVTLVDSQYLEMGVVSFFGRAPGPCGHSEYENMESDVPDVSTDDEGLSNRRRDTAGGKVASGDRRPEEHKETPVQNPTVEKLSHKGTEQPTDDDDDVRSFEEEERRMAHELSVTQVDRSGNTSGQSLPVVSCADTDVTYIQLEEGKENKTSGKDILEGFSPMFENFGEWKKNVWIYDDSLCVEVRVWLGN